MVSATEQDSVLKQNWLPLTLREIQTANSCLADGCRTDQRLLVTPSNWTCEYINLGCTKVYRDSPDCSSRLGSIWTELGFIWIGAVRKRQLNFKASLSVESGTRKAETKLLSVKSTKYTQSRVTLFK